MSKPAISALPAVVLFAATVIATADDDRPPARGAVPQVDIPFDPDTMPSTEKLLGSDLLRSPHWSAKISVRALPNNDSEPTSLNGTLQKRENSFVARLAVAGSHPAELTLVWSAKEATAWLDRGDRQQAESLAPVAKCVVLLEAFLEFPQPAQVDRDRHGRYRFTNLGIVSDGGARTYLLAADRSAQVTASDRLAILGSDQILITIGVDDLSPQKLWATADNGSRFELTFLETSTEIDRDAMPHPPSPPQDSQIVDLGNDSNKNSSSKGDVMVNPVPFDAASIKRGKLLYIADCEVCHSVDGTGRDSDVTDNAADLTNTEFWISDGSETATFLAIRDGAGDEMPGYKDDYGDDKMIWDLVNYIRSLQK